MDEIVEYELTEWLRMLAALVELHEDKKVEIPFSAYAAAAGRTVLVVPDNRRKCYVLTTQ